MVWHSTSPDGTKSVATNRPLMQDNTTYTETTLNVDHFWNIGGDEDGHHQFVQTPATNDADSSLKTNATLATGMDLAFFSRFKTATESTAQQDVQPYAINNTDVMQLLGIRAMGVINVSGGSSTTVYSHNCTVARTGLGRFTVTFTSALPSVNYSFLGGGVGNTTDTGGQINCSVESSTSLGGVKTAALVKFRTILTTGSSTITRSVTDPLQAYFVIFGG